MGALKGLGFALLWGMAALWVAYPVMLVLGIPITLALWKYTPFRLPVLKFAGVLVGLVTFFFLIHSSDVLRDGESILPLLLASVLSGGATAEQVWKRAWKDTGPERSPERLPPL
ncbi:MAG TPA: hypothetical protein VIW92_13115, partial [Thermoanaerobaculia bacterium]